MQTVRSACTVTLMVWSSVRPVKCRGGGVVVVPIRKYYYQRCRTQIVVSYNNTDTAIAAAELPPELMTKRWRTADSIFCTFYRIRL